MKDEYKEYLLNFILQCNSLKDLLDILQNICNNLDLDYLNPQIKHFRYFQFTFFGLMAKAAGLSFEELIKIILGIACKRYQSN